MKNRKKTALTIFASVILAVLTILGVIMISPVAFGASYDDYTYSVSNGEATITGFSGSGDITIPSEIDGYPVTGIGERAFHHNLSLTSVVIPDSVKTIADFSFMSCHSLESVTLGNGVIDIGLEAFMSCDHLNNLKLGNSLKRIGGGAFATCKSIEEVVFPDSVEVIESFSFGYCSSLKTVRLGEGVSEIEVLAFYGCEEINEITVDEENNSFVSIDQILYTKDMATIVWCPTSKTEIALPETVTAIGDSAFASCRSINLRLTSWNSRIIRNRSFIVRFLMMFYAFMITYFDCHFNNI